MIQKVSEFIHDSNLLGERRKRELGHFNERLRHTFLANASRHLGFCRPTIGLLTDEGVDVLRKYCLGRSEDVELSRPKAEPVREIACNGRLAVLHAGRNLKI